MKKGKVCYNIFVIYSYLAHGESLRIPSSLSYAFNYTISIKGGGHVYYLFSPRNLTNSFINSIKGEYS